MLDLQPRQPGTLLSPEQVRFPGTRQRCYIPRYRDRWRALPGAGSGQLETVLWRYERFISILRPRFMECGTPAPHTGNRAR